MKYDNTKLLPLDGSFDKYGAFYTTHAGIFDRMRTGELLLLEHNPKPETRREYPALGVTLMATCDKNLPKFYAPDGTHLPLSWLHHDGVQYLVHDHATNRVVSTRWNNKVARDQVPAPYRRHARIFWPAEGAFPVGGLVMVYPPFDATMTPTEKEQLKSFVAQAQAVMALDPEKFRGVGTYHTGPKHTYAQMLSLIAKPEYLHDGALTTAMIKYHATVPLDKWADRKVVAYDYITIGRK